MAHAGPVTTVPRTRRDRAETITTAFVVAFLAAVCALFVYFFIVTAGPPPVSYPVAMHVLNNPVHPGDVVYLSTQRCVSAPPFSGAQRINFTQTRKLIRTSTGEELTLASLDTSSPPDGPGELQCPVFIVDTLVLPDRITPGTWRLRGTVSANGKSADYTSDDIVVEAS